MLKASAGFLVPHVLSCRTWQRLGVAGCFKKHWKCGKAREKMINSQFWMSFQTSRCRGNFAQDRNLSSPDAHRCFVDRADSISCCFSEVAREPRGTSCSKTWHHWRQMWLLTPTSAESAFHSVSLPALSIFLFELLRLISPWCDEFTQAGCQTPTRASPSLPSAAGQGRENMTKVHELTWGQREITQKIPSQAKQTQIGDIEFTTNKFRAQ